MEFFDADKLSELLAWPDLIESISEILNEPAAVSPERHVHLLSAPGEPEDMLLLKPAWISGKLLGIKAVTFFASNKARGLPATNGSYLLFDGETGLPVAVMDGEELGSRRTMAASALASRFLSRNDALRLLVVGTGQLSPHAVAAHYAVRGFTSVEVWGRNIDKAQSIVEKLSKLGFAATTSPDLDASVASADVISCVTSSHAPLIKGELLQPGTHLDLVGSFKADMREADDTCIARSTVFVDTYEGAILSGDLSQPVLAGVLQTSDLKVDLKALATGAHPGRANEAEITLFKSAGFALEDLAAARLAIRNQS
ncbi:MAG: ornithine cyclodeaminase family protein [Acidimicrobiales bacterium]